MLDISTHADISTYADISIHALKTTDADKSTHALKTTDADIRTQLSIFLNLFLSKEYTPYSTLNLGPSYGRKKFWIQISWLPQKPTDLDQHFFPE